MGNRKVLLESYKMQGDRTWKLMPIPTNGTKPCEQFFRAWARTNSLFLILWGMANSIESMKEIARQSLADVDSEDPEKIKESEKSKEEILENSAFAAILKNKQFIFELLLCRHVDNYLTYLSSLLFEVFKLQPSLLRSDAKIETDILFEQKSIEDIYQILAERKVQKILYEPFNNLAKFFRNRLKIEIATEDDLPYIIEAIEIRNISVHNGCLINRRFVRRVKMDPGHIGKMRLLSLVYVEKIAVLLGDLVKDIDLAAISQFRIESHGFEINFWES